MSENVMTPEARASFAFVHKPQPSKKADKADKYQLTLLFAKDANLSAMKKAATEALDEKFGAKMKDENFRKRLRSPFRDQGEFSYDGYVPGCIFVRTSSNTKPGVVDSDVNDIIDPSDFYSGCYCRATVRAKAYEVDGNVGVTFYLQNVQKLRDGESLSGRMKAQDEFQPAAGTADAASAGSMWD